MRDFGQYIEAGEAFLEELTQHHADRLERAVAVERIRDEQDARVQELTQLRSEASVAALKVKPGSPFPNPPSVDPERIRTAMSEVQSGLSTYGGFLERRRRMSTARAAAAYLIATDPVIQREIETIERDGPLKVIELVAAQSAADHAMQVRCAAHARAVDDYAATVGAAALPFEHEAWSAEHAGIAGMHKVVRLAEGYHWVAGEKHHVPVLARVPGENVFVWSKWMPGPRKSLVNSLLLRALRSSPPGQVKILLIDPTSLGEIFSPLLSISEHSEEVLHTKVWTSESDIRARLEEASDRAGLIIQKYLTDEYDTLEEYNQAAGEVTEPNVVIAVNDFPRGLDARSAEIVKSLAEVGPRCGISLLLVKADLLNEEQSKVCNSISSHMQVDLSHWELANYFPKLSYGGVSMPASVQALQEQVVGPWIEMFDVAEHGRIVQRGSAIDYVRGKGRGWHTEEPGEWSPAIAEPVLQAVGRQFSTGAKVEVRLAKVWQLYDESREDGGSAPLRFDDPGTWWSRDAIEAIEVPVGRHGSRAVTTLRFDSQLSSSALLVGRPGSGKSNLLHVVICTLAGMYPPSELELYLLDFKEAVEFAGYAAAGLPHAKAIALESDREFGLAVLRHLSAEIERRGSMFRGSVGEQSNLITYRTQTGERLPRILLLIDEFHRLFDREDAIASESAKHLDDLIRLGRGFGIHCLLASQTLLGMNALGRHTLNQVAIRVALQCSEEDSRVMFTEDNPAASLMTRPGEGIKNASGGRPAGNEPFQVPLLGEADRAAVLEAVRGMGDQRRRQPRVYQRGVQAPWSPPAAQGGDEPPAIRLGDAVALDPAFAYPLIRESGRNVLVVGRNEDLTGAMLSCAIADLRLRSGGTEITVIDLMAVDGPVDTTARALDVQVRRRREFEEVVRGLAELVDGREPSRTASDTAHLLVINGLGKVRDLDVDDYGEEAQELASTLHTILRDGPEVGVHTIAWCDSVTSLDRRIGRRLEREFGARVAFTMSPEDSLRLCDSEAAAGLHEREALLVDIDRGSATKFQPYERPDLATAVPVAADV